MNNIELIGVIGSIVSVISLPYAIYQHIQIERIKNTRVKQLRRALSASLNVMKESFFVLTNKEYKSNQNRGDEIDRINRIHSNSAQMIQLIFHELSEIDKPYNLKKLKNYQRMGLITSKWVFEQSLIFVKNLSEKEEEEAERIKKSLPEKSPDFIGNGG